MNTHGSDDPTSSSSTTTTPQLERTHRRGLSTRSATSARSRADVLSAAGRVKRRPKERVKIDKPWLEKKDPAEKWLTIIPLTGIALALAISALICYLGIASIPNIKYCLVLDDEFNIFNLNTWSHEIQLGGFGNGQFEVTTNSPLNSYVNNGYLHLVPTLTSDTIGAANVLDGYTLNLTQQGICTSTNWYDCVRVSNSTNDTIINPIQSVRISTKNSVSINTGKVEVRARIPKGDWIWPAIWMMPRDSKYGEWPASGEIDIMESRGNGPSYPNGGDNVMFSSLHWGPFPLLDRWYFTNNPSKNPHAPFSDDFHTFGLEWTEDHLLTWIDQPANTNLYVKFNQPFWQRGFFPLTFENGTKVVDPWSQTGRSSTPFDQDFYLILNVAIGGTNGWFADEVANKPWVDGSPTAPYDFWAAKNQWYSTWPTDSTRGMTIDYVKMWQKC